MATKTASNKVYSTVRAGIVACLVPIFFIYIMIDKPDYKIMNGISGIVVPAAHFIADGVSWPFRIIGRAAETIRTHSLVMKENRELREKLEMALRDQNECKILIAENQRLEHQLDITRAQPVKTIVARIIHDNSALAHNTFILDKGENNAIATGMAVLSFDGNLAGIVISVSFNSAKVRALSDPKSNIPVRVAGSDVYGFLRGNGASVPNFEFYSDPEFIATTGNRLVTSGIKGTVPDNIPVGVVSKANKTSANVELNVNPGKLHDVMVLGYK